jgi:hypothetical protein
MRRFFGFYDIMNEALAHAIGQSITRFAFCSDERPRWLQRIKKGHVLPWMIQRHQVRLVSHAPVMMNRMICSLRLQTHLVK